MTPCESWITMAVFQACVTLAAVQHPEVWISSEKMLPSPVQKKKNKQFISGHTGILQCHADTGSLLKDTTLMASSVFNMRSAS